MINRNYAFGALVVLAGIVYVSLYPFHLKAGVPPSGALHHLLSTWREPPTSSGDVIANVLLYMPWGFFVARSFHRSPTVLRILIAAALGAALSFAMEWAQFSSAERYADLHDVYTNTAGALLGAIAALMLPSRRGDRLARDFDFQLFPALLLAAFIAVRLYPFVPVFDPHKYVAALRPLLVFASLGREDLFLRSVTWLVTCYLAETLFGRRSALLAYILIACGVFLGRVVIADAQLSPPSVVSALLAGAVWFALLRYLPGRVAILAIAFAAVVMLERLTPFRLAPIGHGFEWVPFLDLLRAPIESGFLVMIDKFFLYGALIWLLLRAGLRLWRATVAVALLLLFCSFVEMYLPGRSAGITDALLALIIGILLRLSATARQPAAQPV
ncbi:MAG TPA: VanZ family protein [Stellaceae bacterium]|nr:VanZ family protein [Stellaceae bacterium]